MQDLRRIRRHLDLDSAKLLATALVSSRLDYCNSLLYGIADIDLTRLHSVYRINCPAWWQSLIHLLAVFHCFVLFIGCQWGLEYFLRSIRWPTRPCVKNSLFIFIPYWLHRFLPVHWDQTMIIVCQSLGSRPILVLKLFTLVPVSLEQPAAVCPFSQFSCYLQETSEDTSLWFGLSPIDTVTPYGLLMLQNCFLDFAVEHWFGCRATEPGFAGDIDAIEVWLIDWLIVCNGMLLIDASAKVRTFAPKLCIFQPFGQL